LDFELCEVYLQDSNLIKNIAIKDLKKSVGYRKYSAQTILYKYFLKIIEEFTINYIILSYCLFYHF
jgi:hypothetical protein